MTVRPSILNVLEPLRHQALTSGGCCLHICLHDPNDDDASVDWCIAEAVKRGHAQCEERARLLRQLSKTQRKKLRTRVWSAP